MSERRKIMKVIFNQEGEYFSLQDIVKQSSCKEETVLKVIHELIFHDYLIDLTNYRYSFYNI